MSEDAGTKWTPGAMKAAKLIARSDKLRPLVFGGILRETAAESSAEIIDRETAASQLYKALEGVLPYMEAAEKAGLVGDEGCHWPVEFVRAALRQARGEK